MLEGPRSPVANRSLTSGIGKSMSAVPQKYRTQVPEHFLASRSEGCTLDTTTLREQV